MNVCSYKWTKNGVSLSTMQRFNLVGGDLQITDVQPSDVGIYWCNASNVLGFKRVSTTVIVTGIYMYMSKVTRTETVCVKFYNKVHE